MGGAAGPGGVTTHRRDQRGAGDGAGCADGTSSRRWEEVADEGADAQSRRHQPVGAASLASPLLPAPADAPGQICTNAPDMRRDVGQDGRQAGGMDTADEITAKYRALLERINRYPVGDPEARAWVLAEVEVIYRAERAAVGYRDGRLRDGDRIQNVSARSKT